jgi:hypothetical protein
VRVPSVPILVVLTSLIIQFTSCPAAEPIASVKSGDGDFISDTSSVVRVTIRMHAPGLRPGDFAGLPKTIWRCGTKYMRADELPDSAHGLQQLILVAEPDCWAINLLSKSGQHIVDQGPGFATICPLFEMQDSALKKLEVGRELWFFKSSGSKPLSDEKIGDVSCSVWELKLPTWNLKLWISKRSQLPARITRTGPDGSTDTITYDEYQANLPLDRTLFAPPAGIKLAE